MGHAAALYTVQVKVRYEDYQPLGDIDGQGTYLLDVLAGYFDDFEAHSGDGERLVRCLNREVDGDELTAAMQHGASGVAADIIDRQGNQRIRQVWTDTQLLRCSCFFKLPPNQNRGWLALHVNNGRGIKGLLDEGLPPLFGRDFPELILAIRPFVHGDALRAAIEGNQVAKLRLIRYERPNDRASASTDKWVRAGEFGKLELDISMRGRGQMLKSGPLRRFYRGDNAALGEIFEFEGITFEQAKIEVVLDGRTRTFNLQNPTSGHPTTVDIDLELDDEGEPSYESVIEALRGALGTVVD